MSGDLTKILRTVWIMLQRTKQPIALHWNWRVSHPDDFLYVNFNMKLLAFLKSREFFHPRILENYVFVISNMLIIWVCLLAIPQTYFWGSINGYVEKIRIQKRNSAFKISNQSIPSSFSKPVRENSTSFQIHMYIDLSRDPTAEWSWNFCKTFCLFRLTFSRATYRIKI